jgi:hypothetical protein
MEFLVCFFPPTLTLGFLNPENNLNWLLHLHLHLPCSWDVLPIFMIVFLESSTSNYMHIFLPGPNYRVPT